MSTTYLEVMMKQKDFNIKLRQWIEEFDRNWCKPNLFRLMSLAAPKRPYTDDMFQMLDDLGIEPPLRWFDYTAKEFTWR